MTYMLQEPINASLPTHHAIHTLRNEGAVAPIQGAVTQRLTQRYICIRLLGIDGMENLQRRLPGTFRYLLGRFLSRSRFSQNSPLLERDTPARNRVPACGGDWLVASREPADAGHRRQSADHPCR